MLSIRHLRNIGILCTFSDATYRSHVEQTFTYDININSLSQFRGAHKACLSSSLRSSCRSINIYVTSMGLRQRGIHWATLTRILCFPFWCVPLGKHENIREAVYRGCIPSWVRSAPPLQIVCMWIGHSIIPWNQNPAPSQASQKANRTKQHVSFERISSRSGLLTKLTVLRLSG